MKQLVTLGIVVEETRKDSNTRIPSPELLGPYVEIGQAETS